MKVLEVKDLHVHFNTVDGNVKALNGMDFSLEEGKTLGLVGETGAGKTTTALSILRLIQSPPGKIVKGEILYNGEDLLKKPIKEMRQIRGNEISMIFQDPMTALNPVLKVGEQIAEVIKLHSGCSKKEAWKKAEEMLEVVGIPAIRSEEYPHNFSGGMKQRVVIAMALACTPKLLLADEPTSALDVTIQAQVLQLMKKLKSDFKTSVIMITHDLGVVADNCDEVAIVYAGQIIEYGNLRHIFKEVCHPYTIGLFGSLPSLETEVERLSPIPGLMPDPANLPEGCAFAPRCPKCMEICRTKAPEPVYVSEGHMVKCHCFCEGCNKGGEENE